MYQLKQDLNNLTTKMTDLKALMAAQEFGMAKQEKARDNALEGVLKSFDERIKTVERRAGRASTSTRGISRVDRHTMISSMLTLMNMSDYATKTDLGDYVSRREINNPAPGTSLHKVMKMNSEVAELVLQVKAPAGSVQQLTNQMVGLENKRHMDAVKFGGMVFRDAQASQAWYSLLNDLEAHRFAQTSSPCCP